jgi:hypothetical protein
MCIVMVILLLTRLFVAVYDVVYHRDVSVLVNKNAGL